MKSVQKIDVALEPAQIDQLKKRDLSGVVCIVFDVLRATSSMLTGLASGMTGMVPVLEIEEAVRERDRREGWLLGGERGGEKIDGFDLGNSPFEYREHSGVGAVMTTTNGTVALRACAGAAEIWVGAVLNLNALRLRLEQVKPAEVLLVCAGTGEELALEDVWAAGKLAAQFQDAEWTDGVHVAAGVTRSFGSALDALMCSKNGRTLFCKGRQAEVEWCAQESFLEEVGVMWDGVVARGVCL